MTTFTHSMTLTYNADVRHIVGEVKGPNLLGEFFRAVEANYNAETSKTRVKFEQLRADDVLGEFARATPVIDYSDGRVA